MNILNLKDIIKTSIVLKVFSYRIRLVSKKAKIRPI